MTYSPLATPTATKAVLDSHGLSTKKSLGQHFLIDDNTVGRILALADISPDDIVLEVGPGIGTLTVALLPLVKGLVAVERDDDLVPVLFETTARDSEKFALVHADAVSVDPDELAVPFARPPISLVANLPYGVAATVVLRFFEIMPALQSATVMVQSEVADRMAAHPGTKAYGAYTIKLRLLARTTGRFSVSRTAFLPPPRVDSAVIRLERNPLSDDAALLRGAARLAESAFAQRRKTIRNSMRSTLGTGADQLDAVLEAAGIAPTVRGETLPPETYLELARQFRRVGIEF